MPKFKKHTRYVLAYEEENNSVDFDVNYEPVEFIDPVVKQLPGGRYAVAYAVQDSDASNLLEDCNSYGQIYRRGRDVSQDEEKLFYESIGCDSDGNRRGPAAPFLVLLDRYRHGGESWSVTGRGMQCNWDTARSAGVWVPDRSMLDEILEAGVRRIAHPLVSFVQETSTLPGGKSDTVKYWTVTRDAVSIRRYKSVFGALQSAFASSGRVLRARDIREFHDAAREKSRQLAESTCATYTSWINGDAYGVVAIVFTADGQAAKDVEPSELWGYYGAADAKIAMNDEIDMLVKEHSKTSF